MINKGMFSSKTDQWETPQDFFEELDREFHFDLDPCADETNHKTPEYFTKEQDGLLQDWSGRRVFCNPPYGRAIAKWVEKAYREGTKDGTIVVLLIPARTDARYFHNFILHRSEIRFIPGRLKFGGGGKLERAVCVYGRNIPGRGYVARRRQQDRKGSNHYEGI